MQRWLTPRTRVAIAASVLFAEQPLLGLTAFLSLSVALGDALSVGARVYPSIWVFSRLDHAHALSWTLVRHLSSNGTSTVMISRAHSPSALPSLSAPGLDYAADGPNVAGRSGMSIIVWGQFAEWCYWGVPGLSGGLRRRAWSRFGPVRSER